MIDRPRTYWPWAVMAVLLSWGLFFPASIRSIYVVWMKFALLISKVSTPVILGVVFLALIFPVALIFRVIRSDSMKRKFEGESQTYRVESEKPGRDSLENPFK